MIENAVIGAFIATIWAGLGYAVSKAKSTETFEPIKFFKTLIIGFIVGAISAWLQLPPETMENVSFVGFLTIIIDKLTSLLLTKKA